MKLMPADNSRCSPCCAASLTVLIACLNKDSFFIAQVASMGTAVPLETEHWRKQVMKRTQGIHRLVCQLVLHKTAYWLESIPTDDGQCQQAHIPLTVSTSALLGIHRAVLYGSQWTIHMCVRCVTAAERHEDRNRGDLWCLSSSCLSSSLPYKGTRPSTETAQIREVPKGLKKCCCQTCTIGKRLSSFLCASHSSAALQVPVIHMSFYSTKAQAVFVHPQSRLLKWCEGLTSDGLWHHACHSWVLPSYHARGNCCNLYNGCAKVCWYMYMHGIVISVLTSEASCAEHVSWSLNLGKAVHFSHMHVHLRAWHLCWIQRPASLMTSIGDILLCDCHKGRTCVYMHPFRCSACCDQS